jgi:general secretion pathway protein J
MKHPERRRQSYLAGFTLLEALIATTLMGVTLAAIGSITAQWLPSWNRGFMRVQRSELFAVALNRLAADLAAAEFITPNRESKLPLFEGSASAVTLVRSALGPNTQGGLEVVRIAETTDRQGIVLVRSRAPFAPFGLGDVSASRLNFTDPVVLLRAPFRVSFSYSSGDGSWSDAWQNAGQLPSVVRFLVRDQTTGRTLAVSSATMVHVELPADCASGGSQAPSGGSQAPSGGSQTASGGSQTASGGSQAASGGSQACGSQPSPTAGGGPNAPNAQGTAQR